MKTKEIHISASGQIDDVLTLETTHTRLHELSQNLETCPPRGPALAIVENKEYGQNVLDMQILSRGCKDDYQKLLKMLDKLKISDGSHHRWQTFNLELH